MAKKRLKYSAFSDVVCKKCDGCQKRQEGCHGSCEDYLKEKLTIELLRMDLMKEQAIKFDTQKYLIDTAQAKAKHKHPSTRYGKAGKRR